MKRIVAALAIAIVASVVTAWTATNVIAPSRAGRHAEPIGADEVKPSECNSLTVTTKVTGSGTFAGTSGSDLILGSGGVDEIDGVGGADCILGGGGDDLITGGPGTDVCIGGPGTDTFDASCETTIQ